MDFREKIVEIINSEIDAKDALMEKALMTYQVINIYPHVYSFVIQGNELGFDENMYFYLVYYKNPKRKLYYICKEPYYDYETCKSDCYAMMIEKINKTSFD